MFNKESKGEEWNLGLLFLAKKNFKRLPIYCPRMRSQFSYPENRLGEKEEGRPDQTNERRKSKPSPRWSGLPCMNSEQNTVFNWFCLCCKYVDSGLKKKLERPRWKLFLVNLLFLSANVHKGRLPKGPAPWWKMSLWSTIESRRRRRRRRVSEVHIGLLCVAHRTRGGQIRVRWHFIVIVIDTDDTL